MKRTLVLAYGIAVYLLFLVTILYAIGFVTGIVVPKTVDGGILVPGWQSWAINAALFGLFAVQHMIMARQGFKKRIKKVIPEAAERSTFVLMTCLCLGLMFWQWRALPGVLWDVESETLTVVLHTFSLTGWAIVFITTFLIDHFELFGLAPVWRNFRGKSIRSKGFVTPFIYRYSRHPMYVGFFIAFWMTPTMTTSHLFFAVVAMTWVIFEVIVFEEPDLVREFGRDYRNYQKSVGMFLPARKRNQVSFLTQAEVDKANSTSVSLG